VATVPIAEEAVLVVGGDAPEVVGDVPVVAGAILVEN
jgi:hypothetical protein